MGRPIRNKIAVLIAVTMWIIAVKPAGLAAAFERMPLMEEIPRSCRKSPYGPGRWLRKLTHDGWEREYIVHVPPGYRQGKAVPVVLFFHGAGATARMSLDWHGLGEIADRENFIIVYPDGTGNFDYAYHTFNAGPCGGFARDHGIDDVGFTETILEEVGKAFCIDQRRVYATGMSIGAMMTYRLACELSNRIAAIAPVGGTLCMEECTPNTLVPVIHFHGTADPWVPYVLRPFDPPPWAPRGTFFFTAVETLGIWKRLLGAGEKPAMSFRIGDAIYDSFKNRGNAAIEMWTLRNAGHTWPGLDWMPGQLAFGKVNKDISASELIWDFFSRQPPPKKQKKQK